MLLKRTAASVVYVALGLSGLASAAPCGMLPPDSPDFASERARRAAEMRRDGYEHVCASDLERHRFHPAQFEPLGKAASKLAFQPVGLDTTAFAQMTSLGAMAENVGDITSRFYQAFRTRDGRTIILFEHDMSADGSHMVRSPADAPERINDLPARLTVLQAAPGDAVSILSWKEGRRLYQLSIDANVSVSAQRTSFFALAASLPLSVPARAREPDPPPPGHGPYGRQVILDSPTSLTFKTVMEPPRPSKPPAR